MKEMNCPNHMIRKALMPVGWLVGEEGVIWLFPERSVQKQLAVFVRMSVDAAVNVSDLVTLYQLNSIGTKSKNMIRSIS